MRQQAPPSVVPWLPTLEQAREIGLDLPASEPSESHKMAALIVIAGAIRRETWEEVLPEDRADQIATPEPPQPPRAYEEHTHVWRVGPVANKPGRVRVRHTQDRLVSMCELYMPTLPIVCSFEGAIEQIAQPRLEPPPELACPDLRPQPEGGTAYRGGGKLQEADFYGHDFGDAIDKGARAVGRLGARGTIFLLSVRAFAWPFLWLRYPHEDHWHELVVSPARDGGLALLIAPED